MAKEKLPPSSEGQFNQIFVESSVAIALLKYIDEKGHSPSEAYSIMQRAIGLLNLPLEDIDGEE